MNPTKLFYTKTDARVYVDKIYYSYPDKEQRNNILKSQGFQIDKLIDEITGNETCILYYNQMIRILP